MIAGYRSKDAEELRKLRSCSLSAQSTPTIQYPQGTVVAWKERRKECYVCCHELLTKVRKTG